MQAHELSPLPPRPLRRVFEDDALVFEGVSDLIGAGEVFVFSGLDALFQQTFDLFIEELFFDRDHCDDVVDLLYRVSDY